LRSLILGIGDHAGEIERVGLQVARGLHAMLGDPDVDIIEAPVTGIDLFELAAGYDKVVVVDSVRSGEGDIGELRKLGLSDLELTVRSDFEDGHEYRAVLDRDDERGSNAPLEISIYAIEMDRNVRLNDESTEAIRSVVPKLVEQIAREEFGASFMSGDWY
jgi:hydrogenase maturation protease